VGIRIHKIIGWGLNNIVADEKGKVIDPRINIDFFQSEDYWDKADNVDAFFTWIEKNEEDCVKILREVEPLSEKIQAGNEEKAKKYDIHIFWALNAGKKAEIEISDYNLYPVTYDSEFGKKEILLFSPIDSKDWYRYDDIIDYYESDKQENTVKILTNSCGIYPYLGMVHIPHAPNFGKENYPNTLWPAEYNRAIGVFSPNSKPLLQEPELSYFKKWYRPTIPAMVILHVKYLNIFKYFNETIHELRPMIYTYWA